jgi:glycerol-3-phosphate acyltransferase PlsX
LAGAEGQGEALVIAVDAMGGDFAPQEIVKGVVQAVADLRARVALVGVPEVLQPLLPRGLGHRVAVVPAASVVSMDEPPSHVLREKSDSSMAVAVRLVEQGQAQAVVSAGNSGAFVALARTKLPPIAGIERPAIATLFPTRLGDRLLLDVGANVDCCPEHLLQFGLLGAMYCERVLGLANPRVGLLNIGSEPGKGNRLTRAAASLFEQAPLNFVGFVEGNHIFDGAADVVVCDGFVGNVLLKAGEGLAHLILSTLRASIAASLLSRLGMLLLYPALRSMRQRFDYASYGGALLLGVRGICVVCHGRSHAGAIANALRVAERAVLGRVVEAVAEAWERARQVASEQPA